MSQIPDVSQLGGRPQVSPTFSADYSPIYKAAEGRADALMEAGKTLGKASSSLIENQSKIEVAIAEGNLLKKQLEFDDSLNGDTDYSTFQKRHSEWAQKTKSELAAGIKDTTRRELFNASADAALARQASRINDLAFKKYGESSLASVNQLIENNKELFVKANSDIDRQRIVMSTGAAIDGLAPWLSPVDRDKSKKSFGESVAELRLQLLPPQERIAILNAEQKPYAGNAPTDSASAITTLIDRFEGDRVVPKDGKHGASKYGIEAQANGLTDEQVANLTREQAEGIYKQKYWDGIGADNLPENIRFAAFDTAVNFGQEQAKQWLAESGGDPEKLMALRAGKHKELAEKDPATFGKYSESWKNRNEAVGRMTLGGTRSGTLADMIPIEKRQHLIKQAEADLQKELSVGKAQLSQDLQDARTSILTTGTYPKMNEMGRDRFITYLGPESGQREYEDFQDTVKTGKNIQSFKMMPASGILKTVQDAAPKAGQVITPEEERNYGILKNAGEFVIKTRADDPITFGMQNGLVPQEPLDFNDKAKISNQLIGRATIAKTMESDYGTPIAVFTKGEAASLAANLDSMTPNQQLGLFMTIRDSVKDQSVYRQALQQIRPDSTVTAMAGAMAGMDSSVTTASHWFKPNESMNATQAASLMLRGEALINPTKADKATDGKGKAMPMPVDGTADATGLRNVFANHAGAAFRNQPQAADMAYQGYRAVYAALSAEEGDYSGTLNSERAGKAAKITLGVSDSDSSRKYLPPYGMDETTFRDAAKARFADAIYQNKFDPKTTRFDAVSFENAGSPGRYYVQVGAGYLIGKDNKPVVIDVLTKQTGR